MKNQLVRFLGIGGAVGCVALLIWILRMEAEIKDLEVKVSSREKASSFSLPAKRSLLNAEPKRNVPSTPSPQKVKPIDRAKKDAMRRLEAIDIKENQHQMWGRLYRRLNVNRETLEQFRDLLVERTFSIQEAIENARIEGKDLSNDEVVKALTLDSSRTVDGRIRSLLGEANFELYNDYLETYKARVYISRVEHLLEGSSSPLTDDQAEQLVTFLFQTNFLTEKYPVIENGVVEKAQHILNPQQLDALKNVQSELGVRRQTATMLLEGERSQ